MKAFLISLLKKFYFLYALYYYTFSYILQLLGLIIKANKKEILFVCYGGRKYGDNVKPIYDFMLKDDRFKDWSFVWAFRKPQEYNIIDNKRTKCCKIDSVKYYIHALRSKCWITNVTVQRGLNFKNKGTFYVNTWHGVPLKRIGLDIPKGAAFRVLNGKEDFDLLCAMGDYDANVYKSAFGVDETKIAVTGYPRNDVLNENNIKAAKERLSKYYDIDYSKKIILYAPTYRDYNKEKDGAFSFDYRLSTSKFLNKLGNNYQLLVRAHGAIEKKDSNTECLEVTTYPCVEDLLLITDILVTDYSGIMFDFANLNRTIICFAYDLEKYQSTRGMYVDLNEFIPFKLCYNEDDLYSYITNIDYNKSKQEIIELISKCGLICKNAAQNVVNEIYRRIEK